MKKINLLLSLFFGGFILSNVTSCGNEIENLISSFTIKEVGNVYYNDELDFSKLVNVDTKSGELVAYKITLTSLTPSTIAVKNSNSSVAIVIGIGECKVKVGVENLEKEVSFASYENESDITETLDLKVNRNY